MIECGVVRFVPICLRKDLDGQKNSVQFTQVSFWWCWSRLRVVLYTWCNLAYVGGWISQPLAQVGVSQVSLLKFLG